MMIAMMVAGIGSVLAGLLVILYGIPIREFGFGNTLILIGVLGVCTGMILLALSAVVAELKVIARRLMDTRVGPETRPRPVLPSATEPSEPVESPTAAAPPVAPLAMQDDIPPRDAPPPEVEATEAAPAAPPARPKRNSAVRVERAERSRSRAGRTSAGELRRCLAEGRSWPQWRHSAAAPQPARAAWHA